jgi:two-component system, cell cycle response regulator
MAKESKLPSTSTTQTVRVMPHSAHGQRRLASLLVVQGADIDLGRHVPCEEPVVIGRDPGVGLPLNDGSISREHCRVEPDAVSGGCILVDLGSTNGTHVNGTKVRGRIALRQGDKIFLGVSVIRFGYVDAVDLEYHARLEEMARTDPLTGLFSRRQYESIFQMLGREAVESELPLSVMVFDLDGLKAINDTHGHEMGAWAIAETGRVIRAELEDHGMLSRFGGDELVGCFPGLAKREAAALAEGARVRMQGHEFIRDGVQVHPTISIGVATYPDDATAPEALFEAADRALYEAKRGGKNRVVAAPQVDPCAPRPNS